MISLANNARLVVCDCRFCLNLVDTCRVEMEEFAVIRRLRIETVRFVDKLRVRFRLEGRGTNGLYHHSSRLLLELSATVVGCVLGMQG